MQLFELILIIFFSYILGVVVIGWFTAEGSEKIFHFSWIGGLFLWPLALVLLTIYGIWGLIKKFVEAIKNA
jgi:hypothetical protein